MTTAILILWLVLNFTLGCFVAHEFFLMLFALFKRKRINPIETSEVEWPFVAVQLPIYNEKFVVERLLDAVCKLDYPSEKLEIQILDDSTDETSAIITNKLKNLETKFTIHHIQRNNRDGYKAGALKYGMEKSKASFFAIFDADFIPEKNFLLATIPHFKTDKIGVVQTRWSHLNEDHSFLTRAESVMLDAHFGIEQLGRNNANGFINFNGTAGIWRRTCIEDAGGWQGDTLTEDLDLSFRAQIKKWKIHYLFNFESPAELPLTFNAYRNQQYRWAKGAAECFRKNRKLLWTSDVSLNSKIIGTLHLLNSSVYILVMGMLLFAPIIYFIILSSSDLPSYTAYLPYLGIVNSATLIFILMVGKLSCSKKSLKFYLYLLPSILIFLGVSLAIAPYMAIAVINGYRGKKSEFVRTPKFGQQIEKINVSKTYLQKAHVSLKIIELILLSYGLFWIVIGILNMRVISILYGTLISIAFILAIFFGDVDFKTRRIKS